MREAAVGKLRSVDRDIASERQVRLPLLAVVEGVLMTGHGCERGGSYR